MKKITATLLGLGFIGAASCGFAQQFGLQVNYSNGNWVESVPKKTQQYGAQLQWFPQFSNWGWLQIYLQGGAEYLTTNLSGVSNKSMYTFGAGPMLRINILPGAIVNPYLVAGAEPSYLSRTRFGGRNLGINFAFRDTLGVGATFGNRHQFDANIAFIHYSNASIAQHNSGISLPIEFALAYQF